MDTETLDKLYLEWSQFTKAISGREYQLISQLESAIGHIEHMAKWISDKNAGYSFESLGEDLPDMKGAVAALVPDIPPTKLHFSNDWLKAKIEADPDDTP